MGNGKGSKTETGDCTITRVTNVYVYIIVAECPNVIIT